MTGYFHRSSLVAREDIEGRVRQLLLASETEAKPAILDEIDVLLHAAHVDPVRTPGIKGATDRPVAPD